MSQIPGTAAVSRPGGARAQRPARAPPLGAPRARGADATPASGRALAALAAAAALALAAGCDPAVEGNGVYADRTRTGLPAFAGIRMESGVDAVVTAGPGLAQVVRVTGDSNLVDEHVRTAVVDPELGGTAVPTLRVWVDRAYTALVPLRVIVTIPDLVLAAGRDGSALTASRPAGSTSRAGTLRVDLSGASLDATGLPARGAEVTLTGASVARLHSDGPVTGSVGAGSLLENLLGGGPCLVTTTAGATVRCAAAE